MTAAPIATPDARAPRTRIGKDRAPKDRAMVRRAAISAWLGSALEYYDFFIYGTAASMIFPKIMYDPKHAFQANIMSTATFGVAYLVRPVGSFLMGFLGDRHGRKLVMFLTLFGMGAATFLIGCLPTYAMVGGLAPALIILLRVLQGLAVAGEQSSATTMVLEHSTDRTRGFYSSFTLGGTQLGFVFATAIFIPLASMSDHALYTWGWRVPFLASSVVMLLAWWIRRSVEETPEFQAQRDERRRQQLEAAAQHEQALRRDRERGLALHPADVKPLTWLGWFYLPTVARVMLCCWISVVSTVMSIYALNYGTGLGINRVTILWMQIAANVVALGAILGFGALSDRLGRKPVYLFGAVGCALVIFPFILAVVHRNVAMIFFWGILGLGVVYSGYSGAGMGMFSEQFETKVRVTGMAIATQFGFALGGFAPTIITLLQGSVVKDGKTVPNFANWQPAAVFTAVVCAVAAAAALFNRETKQLPQQQLGSPAARRAHAFAAEQAGQPLPQATQEHPASARSRAAGLAAAVLAVVTLVVWLATPGAWWAPLFVVTGILAAIAWNGAARAAGEIALGAPYRVGPRLALGRTLGRLVGIACLLVVAVLLVLAVVGLLSGTLKL